MNQETPWRISLSIRFSVDIEASSVRLRPEAKTLKSKKSQDLVLTTLRKWAMRKR